MHREICLAMRIKAQFELVLAIIYCVLSWCCSVVYSAEYQCRYKPRRSRYHPQLQQAIYRFNSRATEKIYALEERGKPVLFV